MSRATLLAVLVLAAALLLGCGGSSSRESSTGAGAQSHGVIPPAPAGARARHCRAGATGATGLTATGATCTEARRLMLGWTHSSACQPATGASRSSCSALSYRCLATATGRGWSVSCSKPGRSIGFTARRD
ncbi:MAG: hypothetical protein ACTHK3_11580 [Solirubrobacterales bacterium]